MLFPEIAPVDSLKGIARLAADSPTLEAKRRVEYLEIATRRWIGRASGKNLPFEWTINPYRGCEYGCKYCYARYAHEFMELTPESFEERIYAKQFDEGAFEAELVKIPRRESIAIGTATDPYQPAERRYGVTRRVLTVLARHGGYSFGIATKSDLVARDADLLAQIGSRNWLHVAQTVTTMDAGLARLIEPYAPRPQLRLAAMKKLSRAGVRVTVMASPLLPLINDSEASLEAVAAAAAEAGAEYLTSRVLFLKPCAQQVFFPFLERVYPHLLRRYRERFEKDAYLRGEYPKKIAARVERVRAKFGLTVRPGTYEINWAPPEQLGLFEDAV